MLKFKDIFTKAKEDVVENKKKANQAKLEKLEANRRALDEKNYFDYLNKVEKIKVESGYNPEKAKLETYNAKADYIRSSMG